MNGFLTLFYKELLRFWRVSLQTVLAPVITMLLYLMIFAQALHGTTETRSHSDFILFLAPGLTMMAMLQNAFANASSSLVQSRLTGNLIFILLPPLSYTTIWGAYVLASAVRGLAVGIVLLVVALFFAPISVLHPGWALFFAAMGCIMLGTLGVFVGIVAEKFDQMASFQNFIITPMTFLAGVFYSTHQLSPFWRTVSALNPFFYLVDGFRYGFIGQADVSPIFSLAVVSTTTLLFTLITLGLLKTGYKLRS